MNRKQIASSGGSCDKQTRYLEDAEPEEELLHGAVREGHVVGSDRRHLVDLAREADAGGASSKGKPTAACKKKHAQNENNPIRITGIGI